MMWVTVTGERECVGNGKQSSFVAWLVRISLSITDNTIVSVSIFKKATVIIRHGRYRLVIGQGEPKQPHRAARLDVWANFALLAALQQ